MAADGFMARWHRPEVEKSWLRLANEDAGREGGGGAAVLMPLSFESRENWRVV